MTIGEYYKEMDKRIIRYVQVEGILHSKQWVYIRNVVGGKRTRADMNRFDGRSGGYRLVEEKEVKMYILEAAR